MAVSSPIYPQSNWQLPLPHLLIATAKCRDTPFAKKLVLLHQQDSQGSRGMIINEPLPVSLGEILDQLNMPTHLPSISQHAVLFGGPNQKNRGHILTHEHGQDAAGGWLFTGQKQALQKIARGEGPKDFIIAIGHTAWAREKLTQELRQGMWIIQPVHINMLFHVPIEDRWEYAQSQLSFDMRQMSHLVGHG